MNRPETYQKTVDILVQAYFDDSLIAMDCAACACGNIIRGNLNAISGIPGVPIYTLPTGEEVVVPYSVYDSVKEFRRLHIAEVVNYSEGEFKYIERVFMDCYTKIRTPGSEPDYFEPLMAVIELLDEIHENNDEEITKHTKGKFLKVC